MFSKTLYTTVEVYELTILIERSQAVYLMRWNRLKLVQLGRLAPDRGYLYHLSLYLVLLRLLRLWLLRLLLLKLMVTVWQFLRRDRR